MNLVNQCKPILAQRERKDLLQFVRKEIVDLKADEEVEEVTAEMVVDNLTPAQKKYAESLK